MASQSDARSFLEAQTRGIDFIAFISYDFKCAMYSNTLPGVGGSPVV
jgi:hypothetical protein